MVVGLVVVCCFHGQNFYLSVDPRLILFTDNIGTPVYQKSIKIGITPEINSQMSIVWDLVYPQVMRVSKDCDRVY